MPETTEHQATFWGGGFWPEECSSRSSVTVGQACWAAAEACPDRGETPAGGCGLERAGQWLGWSFRGPLRYCSCYSEGCLLEKVQSEKT